MEILSLLWIVRALHILETAGKIFEAAGKYRTEALVTICTLNTAGVEKGSSTHWFTGQLLLMVMVRLVENDHIIIEDEQLSTDYYYAFKAQKQGMINFLLFIFMK